MSDRVFADYNQAELDAQYDNQRACPDFAGILERAAQLSQGAAGLAGERDVRWGDDARESLDIYRPAAPGPLAGLPVVVYVHGGGWLILDKSSSAFAAPAFTEAGCLFVALGFHTAQSVDFSTMVERVRHGIGWIAQNIHRHGGDPARIVLVGHSSGTHLVTQCLMHDWTTLAPRARPFAGAVLVSGLGDLEPVRLSYRNTRLKLTQPDVARYSLLASEVSASCPVDVLAAQDDTQEFQRQAADMASYLHARGLLRQHYVVPGKNHFDVILDLADPGSRLFQGVHSLASSQGQP
ncbi:MULTISPECIES: alpha/beta hydrolase [Polaromonas]|uniref:Alpha/beta hydrolase n=1 Tax=Polaromonas aquatica TaxID=332657 RepID=A0ABW1TSH3_9BURK